MLNVVDGVRRISVRKRHRPALTDTTSTTDEIKRFEFKKPKIIAVNDITTA